MPKRSDTIETVLMALELLRRIPRKNKVSAPELHAQLTAGGFDRDLRTVQRQLEMLSEHFDIERDDRSKPYGYRWKEQAKGLALPALSEQESLLLTLAQQHLRNLLPSGLMKSMEGFFNQARSNLGHLEGSRRGREWLGKVRVVSENQPLIAPKIRAGVFEEISNALYANHWLAIGYKNAAGKTTQAEVMPLGLAQQGPRLYLVCRFKGFDNERSLAVHRVTSAKMSTLSFKRPAEFDLKEYDADGRFGFGDGKRVKLSFLIDKGVGLILLESPLSEDQTVMEEGNRLRVSATVVDSLLLKNWLRGFEGQITEIKISELH